MNSKVAKKIRKYAKRDYIEYVNALMEWPWMARFRFAWYLVRPRRKKIKERRPR